MASAASAWSAFAQIRDAIFAKVGQRAVRELAVRTFRHLHALSLKFHLERRTGGLSRIISRGTTGIDTVLRFSLFNTFPTALEIVMVCGVLAWSFGWLYALVVLVTVAALSRLHLLRPPNGASISAATMNEADTDASTKAIDSLLNFETVKYFGNEEHEARALRALDGASMRAPRSRPGSRSPCSMPARPRLHRRPHHLHGDVGLCGSRGAGDASAISS